MSALRSGFCTLACSLLLAACSGFERRPPQLGESELVALAHDIHERVITLDTHCDFRVSNFTAERNYTQDLPSQVTLPKMEAGGLDVAWLVVFAGQGPLDEAGFAEAHATAMGKFEAIHRLCEEFAPERIELALTSEDVRRIAASGKKVAMIGIENGYPIGLDLANVERFHALGGRYMSLCHQGHSQLADSNTGEKDDQWLHGGLSELGREVVREMNRVGMMIDLSHPSKAANLQAMALSRAPVIASHSAARRLNDVSRNLDDEELQALRACGGVVQTVAFRSYVDKDKHAAWREERDAIRQRLAAERGIELLSWSQVSALDAAAQADYQQQLQELKEALEPHLPAIRAAAPPVDVADFVDHVDYLVDTIGIDHVGISSDFDGGGGVEGWNDASETLAVTLELVRRGYDEGAIEKLWSGNLLRVLDEVQAVAARMAREG